MSKLLLQTLDWKAGVRRRAWQWAGPAARDTESEAGLEISSYFLRLNELLLSLGSAHLSSAWGLCKMKMQRWILEATSLKWPFFQRQTSLPSPSLVSLSKNSALMCQTDPGSWESAPLLCCIWQVSEEELPELKDDFLHSALLGILSQENDPFCLKSFHPCTPCPRLPHSPRCKPHWLQNNSWCGSALHFNPADIFPAEALIPSWISSPLVPRNE